MNGKGLTSMLDMISQRIVIETKEIISFRTSDLFRQTQRSNSIPDSKKPNAQKKITQKEALKLIIISVLDREFGFGYPLLSFCVRTFPRHEFGLQSLVF